MTYIGDTYYDEYINMTPNLLVKLMSSVGYRQLSRQL